MPITVIMDIPENVEIIPFETSAHLEGTLDILSRVRAMGHYPPRIANDATRGGYLAWLLENPDSERWVALRNGSVISHLSIELPRDYIRDFLVLLGYPPNEVARTAEISKIFVDPDYQHEGIGSALFSQASAIIRKANKMPIITVLKSSPLAIRFYQRQGGSDIGVLRSSSGRYSFGIGKRSHRVIWA